ncbi:MAG: NUDIX hydrolase [Gammaproteobacteria bacterium]|nr:NUDIX hydrolase [Gammaproteobacteria bacterium]
MNFCNHCGETVILKIPEDDNRQRYVCLSCEMIHYQNPKVVTGCLPVWEDKILLCKRAIEPRYGLWTLPAGFMELGETTVEAAARETMEEANARVNIQGLYVVINLPQVDQVFMMFRSQLLDLDFAPGVESLAVELYTKQDIPWDSLAFGTIRQTLDFFFEDQQTGDYPLHVGDIVKHGDNYSFRPGPAETA